MPSNTSIVWTIFCLCWTWLYQISFARTHWLCLLSTSVILKYPPSLPLIYFSNKISSFQYVMIFLEYSHCDIIFWLNNVIHNMHFMRKDHLLSKIHFKAINKKIIFSQGVGVMEMVLKKNGVMGKATVKPNTTVLHKASTFL